MPVVKCFQGIAKKTRSSCKKSAIADVDIYVCNIAFIYKENSRLLPINGEANGWAAYSECGMAGNGERTVKGWMRNGEKMEKK
ncbi:hypothetical protein POVCU2_0039150 [Plasmodium ovale curtisi]|uniref:Uncharacterized protein n=1 Tax=Plasmodium ovale curtisi TaxID=864141 RepID=A0A1A8W6K4_PLAOA|nr:hypothetical protein POVCU2_0039150 [Plasmodium ovale curtisi]SBS97184.1 hypothetical protein POVCU1_036180 [Plasmodium ovale curtisi]